MCSDFGGCGFWEPTGDGRRAWISGDPGPEISAAKFDVLELGGRFLPGEKLVVRNVDIGGGENSAWISYPLGEPGSYEIRDGNERE